MSAMSSEEIRAAAETYSELGPGYRDAVIESFLEKVGGEIDARVAARLAALAPMPGPTRRQRRGSGSGSPLALAVISMVLGIPISAIAVAAGDPSGWRARPYRCLAGDRGHQSRLRDVAPRPGTAGAGPDPEQRVAGGYLLSAFRCRSRPAGMPVTTPTLSTGGCGRRFRTSRASWRGRRRAAPGSSRGSRPGSGGSCRRRTCPPTAG